MSTVGMLRYVSRCCRLKTMMVVANIDCRRSFATTSNRRFFSWKWLAVGFGVGVALRTTYSSFGERITNSQAENLNIILDQPPKVKIMKEIKNSDSTNFDIILFQYQNCPYCCKVRSMLDFYGLNYSIVEVDAVLRQDLKWSDYRKVPILLLKQKNGKCLRLVDSSAIISIVSSLLHNPEQEISDILSCYPSMVFHEENGKSHSEIINKYFVFRSQKNADSVGDIERDERTWRTWADERLVHLISPNVYRTWSEAVETFKWFSKSAEWESHFPYWESQLMIYGGANIMWLIAKRLKKKHLLSEDVRTDLFNALNSFTSELQKRSTKFLGGHQPNLADLSIYGVLCSMEGCSAFKDCLENTEIGTWFYRMKDAVQNHNGRQLT